MSAGDNLLDGVRILDLTRMLAGPYGSMLLADMGAEVIKIEQPRSGDPIRRMGPPFIDGESAYFLGINRNKRSVTLDLASSAGRSLFLELVAVADVVMDNFRPGVMDRLGLAADSLRAAREDIIICAMSAFGPDGPYRDVPAFDLTLQALGGGMSLTGHPGGDPARMGLPIGDLAGGMFAAQAISAALFKRERSSVGSYIDLSLLDIQVSLLTYMAQYHFADGRIPRLMGTAHESVVPYQSFNTADGQIVIAVFVNNFWKALCDVLDLGEIEDRYPEPTDRLAGRDVVISAVAQRLATHPTAYWIERLWASGVPSAPLQTIDEVVRDPQVLHREMVVTTGPHPVVGPYRTLGNPVKVGQRQVFAPAPLLGDSNEAILGRLLGHGDEELEEWRANGVI